MGLFQKIQQLYRYIFPARRSAPDRQILPLQLSSEHLGRKVQIDLYLPKSADKVWSLLLLNDGQDAAALRLKQAHSKFNQDLLIVGIHAADRMQEYGTADILNDKGLGRQAAAYQDFILLELLPYLHRRYPISARPERVGIAGCSLGGLSAIDIAWSWPKVFGVVGIFSGSLWWRDQPFDPLQPDANRVMHQRVEREAKRAQRIWLMAGTADETSDRNKNGIIDAIDDTLQLITLLKDKIPNPDENIRYVEVEKGEHNPATWAKVLPDFMRWGFLS